MRRGDTSGRLAGTYRSIRCAQLRPMRPVSGRLAGHPRSRKNQPNQDDAPCQHHHPLGIWQGHDGPGNCCCSSSGSPPRSWLPWWPRPPCCPSPNRRAGSPASRCRRCQQRQPRRQRRTPPLLPRGRPPRRPLPPSLTLGGEPSADRPRPPDRPPPTRRPQSVVRPQPRRPPFSAPVGYANPAKACELAVRIKWGRGTVAPPLTGSEAH